MYISPRDIESGERDPLLGSSRSSRSSCCQCSESTLETAQVAGQILFGVGAIGMMTFYSLPVLVPFAGAIVGGGLVALCTCSGSEALVPAAVAGVVTTYFTWHPLANVVKAEAITALKWGVPPMVIGGLVYGAAYCLKPQKEDSRTEEYL